MANPVQPNQLQYSIVYDFRTGTPGGALTTNSRYGTQHQPLSNAERSRLYQNIRTRLYARGYQKTQYSFYRKPTLTRNVVRLDVDFIFRNNPDPEVRARLQELNVFPFDTIGSDWTDYASGRVQQPPQ